MIRVTRRYRFCASHRLHSESLTETENRECYGKCSNPYGHGHDYVLEVTLCGPLDPQMGQLLRRHDLDDWVTERVLRYFDHKNLNMDVPDFSSLVPTSENVAIVIHKILNENWNERFAPGGPRIEKVQLQETKRNRFELRS